MTGTTATVLLILIAIVASAAHAQEPPTPAAPTIAASPNPVPADPHTRGTTITWSTGGADGIVRVSVNGGAEQLFARGPAGSSPADWIDASGTFEFRLYLANDPQRMLASVRVRRAQPVPVPTISADPSLVPAGSGLATVTVTWTAGDANDAEVHVARSGEPERLFAKGPSGSKPADWINRTASYEFRLYDTSPSRRLLASVAVIPDARSSATDAPARRNLTAYLLWVLVILLFAAALVRHRRRFGSKAS